MTAESQIQVDITVFNDSDIPGKETVMLYMRDPVASNSRPVQQMVDFKKMEFAAHKHKTISFTVTEEMLRFWNNRHQFVSEPGRFQLSTGYADHLLHTKEFVLK